MTISFLLLGIVGLSVFLTTLLHHKPPGVSQVRPKPLISRNAPAFSNDDCSGAYPAKLADDDSYDTTWEDCQTPSPATPDWITYDLSQVPASQRDNVLLFWYNPTGNYDHTIINNPVYNSIQDYTIEVNAAPGGGQPPTSGWVTKVTVTGNHLHSRDAVFAMTGDNWVRLDITAPDGTPGNTGVSLNVDVLDASQVPAHYPQAQGGGIGGLTSGDGATYVPQWLPLFHGSYVGLGYGTNDALGCTDPTTFYNNYVTMVKAILRAGKIPFIQTIAWAPNVDIQRCAPPLNAKIHQLYTDYPQIIPGPDAWTYFKNHPNLIGSDGVHPNDQGAGALRQLWANTAIASVYENARSSL